MSHWLVIDWCFFYALSNWKESALITAFVVGNSFLNLTLTVLFIRELNRRRGLELVLQQSIELWRNVYEANADSRDFDSGLPDDRRVRD